MKITIKMALLILAPCAILQPLGMDIFVSGIKDIMDDLNVNGQQIQYILAAFMLANGISQLFIGLLADQYGRRAVIVTSTLTFALVSFFCTLTATLPVLTLLRFIQGIAAAGSLVITFAVIRDVFDGNQSSRMFSYLGSLLAVVPMLAPMFGAWLISWYASWHITFYFLTILAVFALCICYFKLPETSPKPIKMPSLNTIWQNEKSVLQNRTFWTFGMSALTGMTGLFLYFSVASIILIDKLGITPYQFSLLFAFNAGTYLIGNMLSSKLVEKSTSNKLALSGNIIIIHGAILMVALEYLVGLNVSAIVISNAVITFGVGLMIGPATAATLQPFEKLAGTAAGLFGTLQYGGSSLIGLLATRFPLNNMWVLAVPMGLLAMINLLLLTSKKNTWLKTQATHLAFDNQ